MARDVRDSEFFEQILRATLAFRQRQPHRLEDRQQILLDGQLPKDRRFLRQVADAALRAQIHRQRRDVVVAERHRAAVRTDQSDDHVEGRRLARAVRPEEADDLALGDVDGDVAHHAATLVDLQQMRRREPQCDLRLLTRRERQNLFVFRHERWRGH